VRRREQYIMGELRFAGVQNDCSGSLALIGFRLRTDDFGNAAFYPDAVQHAACWCRNGREQKSTLDGRSAQNQQ
jgi:hypothetical protein